MWEGIVPQQKTAFDGTIRPSEAELSRLTMRTKILLFIISIALIGGFTMLNVDEFTRTSVLSLGFTTLQLPLGLVMLLIVAAISLIFLVATLYMHSTQLMEIRKYARDLTAQRELADQAEGSRYTQLRGYLESQAALITHRDSDTLAAMYISMAETEKRLLDRMEQTDNTAAAYWGEHDDELMRGKLQSMA